MDVSVVVPTLNEEAYVGECLDDLAAATAAVEEDVEVVVVDSHSDDDTVSIVRSHPLSCRVVYARRGILHARQVGAEVAGGDVIVSVDADAGYPESYLDAILAPFRRREDVALAYGPSYGEWRGSVDAAPRLALQRGLPLAGRHWVSGGNRAFDAAAFEAVGGYDRSQDSTSLARVMAEEQYRFPERMAAEGAVLFVDDAAAIQTPRTLRQLLLVGEKEGGREWGLIRHYRVVSWLKHLGHSVANR